MPIDGGGTTQILDRWQPGVVIDVASGMDDLALIIEGRTLLHSVSPPVSLIGMGKATFVCGGIPRACRLPLLRLLPLPVLPAL